MAAVVTTVGKAALISYLKNNPPATLYASVGTGAGTAAVGDTSLFTEVNARTAVTLTISTTTNANDTMTCTFTLTAVATETWTNVGIWTASSGGTLLYKRDFTGVAVAVAGPNTGMSFTEKFIAA